MSNILRWLLTSSFVKPLEQNAVRHLATGVSGFILAWLVAHNASQSDAANIAQGIASIIIGGAGYAMSQFTKQTNETRVQVAAQTGNFVTASQAKNYIAQAVAAQRAADQAQADKTQAAMTNADKKTDGATMNDELARLRDGKA